MMSPVASETPLPDWPPGVVESSAWPYSCATTSSELIHWLAWLWPMATYEPFQNALRSLSPIRSGKPPPEPLMPDRPNQLPNMSHSRWTLYSPSTQPVSITVVAVAPDVVGAGEHRAGGVVAAGDAGPG